jgi:hypothetical protein
MKYRLIVEYQVLLDMMTSYLKPGQADEDKLTLKSDMEAKFAEVNELEILVGD